MSDSETKITDVQGQYMQVVEAGRQLEDADWHSCRIVLTDRRLVLVADGNESVPLETIDEVGGRFAVNRRAAQVASYLAIHAGDDVLLVSAADHDEFETDFFHACLDDGIIHVKHPAVEGGVVQSAAWTKSRIGITDDAIRFALAGGSKVVVDRDDIGEVAVEEREAVGEERTVVEVEHSEDGISVETYVTGEAFDLSVLRQVLEQGFERNRADLDLGPLETQVVMALHSGVSPFEIPEFVGADVATVEEIYDRLVDLDVIEVVRERTEVEMTAQGRSVAGESKSES